MDIENLRSELEENNQDHLLLHWDSLNDEEKSDFYNELKHIDFAKINHWFEKTMHEAKASDKRDKKLELFPPQIYCSVIGAKNENKVARWREKGLQLISEGKVAVLLLAGGQGTRLGVSYPKGMYNVGLPSQKTLYQLQAEKILKVQELAYELTGRKSTVPWYIMTSEHTMEETKKFIEKHNYFGLQRNDVLFFEQHTIPCLTMDGKIILDQCGKVARAPGGNGGLYTALINDGEDDHVTIGTIRKRGIEYVHVYCVDNILVKMGDPVFVGFCVDNSAECGAKVAALYTLLVDKTLPDETVGVVVKCEDKHQVAEYNEISKEIAEMKDPVHNDRILFLDGNICNHFFTVDFLEKIVT